MDEAKEMATKVINDANKAQGGKDLGCKTTPPKSGHESGSGGGTEGREQGGY
jgi:hypothetical protein